MRLKHLAQLSINQKCGQSGINQWKSRHIRQVTVVKKKKIENFFLPLLMVAKTGCRVWGSKYLLRMHLQVNPRFGALMVIKMMSYLAAWYCVLYWCHYTMMPTYCFWQDWRANRLWYENSAGSFQRGRNTGNCLCYEQQATFLSIALKWILSDVSGELWETQSTAWQGKKLSWISIAYFQYLF